METVFRPGLGCVVPLLFTSLSSLLSPLSPLSLADVLEAVYTFEAAGPFQVSFMVGDRIKIEERIEGWFKGIVLSNGKKGIFPMSFVQVSEKNGPKSDPFAEEILNTCWEWCDLQKSFYNARTAPSFLPPFPLSLRISVSCRSDTISISITISIFNRKTECKSFTISKITLI